MKPRNFTSFADTPLRSREQIAREVHAVSLRRGLDELATVIALMTISIEVGSNDRSGNRQWWCPSNRKDPQSEQFPHDSQSDDGLSSGYFQQQVSRPGAAGRPWGWGGLFGDINGNRKRMSLTESADMFLAALANDYTRAHDNPRLAGEFAQRVQQSGFGGRYQGAWDEAWTVLGRALAQGPVRSAPARRGAQRGTHRGDPTWLEDALRPALGSRLKTLPGWQQSGHGRLQGHPWGHGAPHGIETRGPIRSATADRISRVRWRICTSRPTVRSHRGRWRRLARRSRQVPVATDEQRQLAHDRNRMRLATIGTAVLRTAPRNGPTHSISRWSILRGTQPPTRHRPLPARSGTRSTPAAPRVSGIRGTST